MSKPAHIPNSRRVTLADVAAVAGVSQTTASRALSGAPRVSPKAREAILEAAQRLGYVRDLRATDLARGRSKTIGLLMRGAERPFYAAVAARIQNETDALGLDLLIAAGDSEEQQVHAVENLVGHGVGGLIVVTGRASWRAVELATRYVPTVGVGLGFDNGSCDVLTIDPKIEYQLALRVTEFGHKKVAVTLEESREANLLRSRSANFREALSASGTQVLTINTANDKVNRRDLEEAVASGVTAIMAGDDVTAFAIMELLADMGIECPKDMSVTGFDAVGVYASSLIGITSGQQPVDALAQAAMERLQRRLLDPDLKTEVINVPGNIFPGNTLSDAPSSK